MVGPTAITTLLINRLIPACAVRWEPDEKGIKYLHPTKGWKQVSWSRLRIIPHE